MSNQSKLQVKDLVNIGVFSALYMVVSLILMLPAGIAPILWVLWSCLAGLVCGVFFTLLMVKVQKPGAALLLPLITGVLYFVTGECTWVIAATCVAGGLLAELMWKLLGRAMLKKHFVKAGIV